MTSPSEVIVFDIETIPCQRADLRDRLRGTITPPGNIKKKESIDIWYEDNLESEIDKAVGKTSFDGGLGEVIAISYAIGDQLPVGLWRKLGEDEKGMIESFFNCVATGIPVGHNIRAFDIPFLIKRAMVLGIHIPKWIRRGVDCRPDESEDTMLLWCGGYSHDRAKLDDIAYALGFDGKGEIDGSMVWPMVQKGQEKEVSDYCTHDVILTRQVYNKLKKALA